MDAQILHKYLHSFGNLRRNMGLAPHKPILLLSILDEIERGHITDNEVILTVKLVASFREYWQILPLPPGNWLERVYMPYRYLYQDGFWYFIKNGQSLTGKDVGEPYSIADARSRIHYARFELDLWLLLQESAAREALHAHLLQVYFGITPAQVQPIVAADPVAAQVDRLVADAQTKPKPKAGKMVREGDVEYLRSALFPKVMYSIYDNSCAVCGLGVRVGDSRVLAASHIKDFSLFGDNHPSNGLALCHNHHWAFDQGGFSISDDYKLIASPHMTGTAGFVSTGSSIHLPLSPKCYPDPTALSWHRDNKFRK
ncbi:MAG: HNH endonuclease [Janthinobacterium lividum]